MEMTQLQADQIQETHDAITRIEPLMQDIKTALFGNGQPGLVKDHLTFKTQIKTAIAVVAGFFTVITALILWLK